MDMVEANLRTALARLDRLGKGGSAVAIHVSAALDAARSERPSPATTAGDGGPPPRSGEDRGAGLP